MNTLLYSVVLLLDFIELMILARCIMTWFPNAMESKAYYIVSNITQPIEAPIRNFTSRFNTGPVDITPLVAIFLIYFAQRAIMMIF